MRLPWSGILWCPAGCPVHISTAGKTGRNSQTTKSRHCQLLTKLLWGRTSLKRSCVCLVMCILQCALLQHRKTHRGRAGEWEQQKHGGNIYLSQCSGFWKIFPSRATAWGWYELVSVVRIETAVLRSRNKTKAFINSLKLLVFFFLFFFKS